MLHNRLDYFRRVETSTPTLQKQSSDSDEKDPVSETDWTDSQDCVGTSQDPNAPWDYFVPPSSPIPEGLCEEDRMQEERTKATLRLVLDSIPWEARQDRQDTLDALLAGPEYADNRLDVMLPILTDVRPDLESEKGDVVDSIPGKNYGHVNAFVTRAWRAARIEREAKLGQRGFNAIQGEYMHVTTELAWRTFALFRAGGSSDFEEMEVQMNGVRRVLEQIETLVDVERDARRRVVRSLS